MIGTCIFYVPNDVLIHFVYQKKICLILEKKINKFENVLYLLIENVCLENDII